MRRGSIEHTGRVTEVGSEIIKVLINSSSACAGCHAKSKCGLSEGSTRIIEVKVKDTPFSLAVGDIVDVTITTTEGAYAVVLAYLIPVTLVVLSLWIGEEAGLSELLSFIAMICSVTLYYLILGTLKKRLQKRINIKIDKKLN